MRMLFSYVAYAPSSRRLLPTGVVCDPASCGGLLTAPNRGLKIAAALFSTPRRGGGGNQKGRQDEVQTGAAASGARRRSGWSRSRRAQLRSSPGNAVEARQPARLRALRCTAEADGRAARGGAGSAREGDMEQLRDAVDADAVARLPEQAGTGCDRDGRRACLAGEAQGDLPPRLRVRSPRLRGLAVVDEQL